MPWRHQELGYTEVRPDRVRLQDGSTRTGPDIADQELIDAGWIWEEFPAFRLCQQPYDSEGNPTW